MLASTTVMLADFQLVLLPTHDIMWSSLVNVRLISKEHIAIDMFQEIEHEYQSRVKI